jgi:hypothetical protein
LISKRGCSVSLLWFFSPRYVNFRFGMSPKKLSRSGRSRQQRLLGAPQDLLEAFGVPSCGPGGFRRRTCK